MQKVDKDGSGAIDREEFMILMAEQIEERNQEEELRKVFRMYDDDDEHLISDKNLRRVMDDLNLCDGKDDITIKKEIEMMIQIADKDKNGGVDLEEFIALCTDELKLIPQKTDAELAQLKLDKELEIEEEYKKSQIIESKRLTNKCSKCVIF